MSPRATRDIPVDRALLSDGAAAPSALQRVLADPSNIFTIIGAITSQVALITALFYYFGWARTYSLFGYFGVDATLVGYSTPDYVLRSIDVAFPWFICATFAALALFGLHRLVMIPALMRADAQPCPPLNITTNDLSGQARRYTVWQGMSQLMGSAAHWARVLGHWRPAVSCVRRFIRFLQAFAIALGVVVLTGILFREFGALLGIRLPLLLIASVILFGYVSYIRSKYSDVLAATADSPRLYQSSRTYTLILIALGFVAGIWAISLYGARLGTSHATNIAANLAARSGVVIYSTERIALQGPGIEVSEIAQSGTKYHYHYTGLRLLVRTPDKILLLPSRWQKGRDRVFILRDDDSIRVDIVAR